MTTSKENNSGKSGGEEIASQLLLFPAFSDARKLKRPLKELFQVILDAYEQEQLTEEQDLVLESVLYLHSLVEEFDLRRALTLWDEEDLDQFFTLGREFRRAKQANPQ